MSLFDNKYRIESTRLKNWDYAKQAAYFITICSKDKKHYFGKIENDKMNYSPIGAIADVLWHEMKKHKENMELGEYVIMPNHIHGILILNEPMNSLESLPEDDLVIDNKFQEYMKLIADQPDIQNMAETLSSSRSISSIIRSYKSAVSKHANRLGLDFGWQARFHDHIIRTKKSYRYIEKYIIDNPAKWNEDEFYAK